MAFMGITLFSLAEIGGVGFNAPPPVSAPDPDPDPETATGSLSWRGKDLSWRGDKLTWRSSE